MDDAQEKFVAKRLQGVSPMGAIKACYPSLKGYALVNALRVMALDEEVAQAIQEGFELAKASKTEALAMLTEIGRDDEAPPASRVSALKVVVESQTDQGEWVIKTSKGNLADLFSSLAPPKGE